MKVAFILTAIIAAVLITTVALGAMPAVTDATPAQVIAKQKKTIANLRDQRDELRDEIDAQDAVIETQADIITRLRARDPLDAILARDPDGLWAAAQAIWRAFPTLPPGALCGYDKASTANDGLTPTSLTMYKWTVC